MSEKKLTKEEFEAQQRALEKATFIKFIKDMEDLTLTECIYSIFRRVNKKYRDGNDIGWIYYLDSSYLASLIDLETAYLDLESWVPFIKNNDNNKN